VAAVNKKNQTPIDVAVARAREPLAELLRASTAAPAANKVAQAAPR
jgi:hypothetical protein